MIDPTHPSSPKPGGRFPGRFSVWPRRRWQGDALTQHRQWQTDRTILVLLLVALAGGVVALGARPLAQKLKAWHARRLAKEGIELIESRKWREANAKVADASRLAPGEAEVRVARARLFAQGTPAQEVQAWREVIDAFPGEPEHYTGLALALLRAGLTAEAAQTLERLPESLRGSGRARLAEGLLRWREGNASRAESALREAVQLLPRAPEAQLALARFLVGGSGVQARAGVELLERLRAPAGDPEAGRAARFALLEYFLGANDLPRSLGLARELAEQPGADFSDMLLLATVLARAGADSALAPLLQRLIENAEGKPGELASLLAWLQRNGRQAAALELAGKLPVDIQRKAGLTPALAGLWESVGRRAELRELLRQGDWSEARFVRAAYLARTAEQDGNRELREAHWARALAEAGADPVTLQGLLAFAVQWRWGADQLELHRRLAALPHPAPAQLQAWWEAAATLRHVPHVFDATRALLAAGIDNVGIRNDFAATALLLGRELPRAHTLALQNFQAQPDRLEVAATWATSLRLQGRVEEALRVIARLPSDSARAPEVEMERAFCFAAAGRKEEAKAIASRVRVEVLTTEEQALWRELMR